MDINLNDALRKRIEEQAAKQEEEIVEENLNQRRKNAFENTAEQQVLGELNRTVIQNTIDAKTVGNLNGLSERLKAKKEASSELFEKQKARWIEMKLDHLDSAEQRKQSVARRNYSQDLHADIAFYREMVLVAQAKVSLLSSQKILIEREARELARDIYELKQTVDLAEGITELEAQVRAKLSEIVNKPIFIKHITQDAVAQEEEAFIEWCLEQDIIVPGHSKTHRNDEE